MDTQPSRERPVIVIVEDDVATLDLLCELLTEEGYQTVCCRTVNDAQERIRQGKPDLVILDVHLDGSASGLTVLDILRLTPATAELPIIICSADTTLLKEKAYELSLGNCEVIEKPFDIEMFVETVGSLVTKPRQAHKLQTYPTRTEMIPLRERSVGEAALS